MNPRLALLPWLGGLSSAWAVASEPALSFKPAQDPALPGPHQWLWALLLCALALGLALWWLRRAAPGRWPVQAQRQLQVLERQALGPNAQLVLLRYGGRRLLLSVGPAGVQCLSNEVQDADKAAKEGS